MLSKRKKKRPPKKRHRAATVRLRWALQLVAVIVGCITSHANYHECRADQALGNPIVSTRNMEAVRRIQAGTLSVANAAWWGFDRHDATRALQAAIDSGAKRVVIPYMGADWNVRPITLASDQEIIFEPGVVIAAKKGAFLGEQDCLMLGNGVKNVTLHGYDAVLRMRKPDYVSGSYKKAEWRHALSLRGASDVTVLGLRLEGSGGDGIYLGSSTDGKRTPCRRIYIRDCVCDDNHRQGISVISAENLRIENCTFSNTSGTNPQAGLALEPNHPADILADIEIRNCRAIGNAGFGFLVYLDHLTSQSRPVSVRFTNCLVRSSRGQGMMCTQMDEDAPSGVVEFNNCTCEALASSGLYTRWNTGAPVKLRFVGCKWRQTAGDADVSPIHLRLVGLGKQSATGGIEFVDCYVYGELLRGFLRLSSKERGAGTFDVTGEIHVVNGRGGNAGAMTSKRLSDLRVSYYRRK